ncbi:MAG: hypothetical protein AB2L14_05500 [Candidatus Xenobiia bacterium LiM19]
MSRYPGPCQLHPEVETKMTCCRCHMYVCNECRKYIGAEIYCPICYNTPHIHQLAKKDKRSIRNSVPVLIIIGLVLAIVMAAGFGRLNALHHGKIFFLTFFMGAFIGVFITVVAGGRRGLEYQLISLFCGMVSIVLGDILYLMGSGFKINSFADYFIQFQSHSIYYYLSMFLGMVNAYAIPAKPSSKTLGNARGKSPDDDVF